MKKIVCIAVLFFTLLVSGCAIVPARHMRGPYPPPHIRGPYRVYPFEIIVPPVRFMVPGPVIVL